ncbi:hypothetical protein DYB32_010350 [Aphanomyces invadans]|uniref:Uncharacterized protein n=1 Tax=Aphanomyces invadans TaxID=157072 RepID=A0A3R6Y070_9STRA|nr:hypothetical protein DYB32_010350 [Aphanomyces invadans]
METSDDSTEALEQEWAASIVQHSWRAYTQRQWSTWRQHVTSHGDVNENAASTDQRVRALNVNDQHASNGGDDVVPFRENLVSQLHSLASVSSVPNNGPLQPLCHDTPPASQTPQQAEPHVDDDVVHARLESDALFQSLKAKESVLDLQVNVLLQQQQALEARQQKLRQIKAQKDQEAKERKKLAKLRARECKELEARRQAEAEKFRALETMHIIKTVDAPPAIPKTHQTPVRKRQPIVHVADVTPMPKMKSYAKLPGLQVSQAAPSIA